MFTGLIPSSFTCTPLTHINPLNAELNPICYLLTLLGAHHFLHVSRIKVNLIITSVKFMPLSALISLRSAPEGLFIAPSYGLSWIFTFHAFSYNNHIFNTPTKRTYAINYTYYYQYSPTLPTIVQQDATMYSLLYFCKLLYMFRVVTPPIIRSTYNCNYSIWHRSNCNEYNMCQMSDAVITVICAPDYGWSNHLKHVEQFTEI